MHSITLGNGENYQSNGPECSRISNFDIELAVPQYQPNEIKFSNILIYLCAIALTTSLIAESNILLLSASLTAKRINLLPLNPFFPERFLIKML